MLIHDFENKFNLFKEHMERVYSPIHIQFEIDQNSNMFRVFHDRYDLEYEEPTFDDSVSDIIQKYFARDELFNLYFVFDYDLYLETQKWNSLKISMLEPCNIVSVSINAICISETDIIYKKYIDVSDSEETAPSESMEEYLIATDNLELAA